MRFIVAFFGVMAVGSVRFTVKWLLILALFGHIIAETKSDWDDEPLTSSDIVPAKLCPKCQKLESGLFERFIFQYVNEKHLVMKLSK